MDLYAKAITAFLVAFLGAFQVSILGDSAGGDHVVSNEWVIIVVTALSAGLAVWAVPNDERKQ